MEIIVVIVVGIVCFWAGWIVSASKPATECAADSHDFDMIVSQDRKATFVCLDCGKKLVVDL